MMSGARQNVKSCLRTERKVPPPLTHHNTHTLTTAPQPGEPSHLELVLLCKTGEINGEMVLRGRTRGQRLTVSSGFKNYNIAVTWFSSPVHQADL